MLFVLQPVPRAFDGDAALGALCVLFRGRQR